MDNTPRYEHQRGRPKVERSDHRFLDDSHNIKTRVASIHFLKEQYDWIQTQTVKTGVTRSALVRQAIQYYMETQ